MSDTLTFSCQHCGSSLTVPASLAGVSGPCPVCGQTITSPRLPGSPVPPSLSPPANPASIPPPSSILSSRAPAATPGQPLATPPLRREDIPLTRPQTIPAEATAPARESTRNHSRSDSQPESGTGSSAAMIFTVLLLVGAIGAGAWYFFRPFFQSGSSPEMPVDKVLATGETNPPTIPAADAVKTIPSAPTPPEEAPLPPPKSTDPIAATKPPSDPLPPAPEPEPPPPPAPEPTPTIPTPGTIDIASVVPPAPPDPTATPPELQEAIVREFQSRLDSFFQAETPQARGPLFFSEIDEASKLGEAIQNGALSKIPKLEYKAVLAFDGPRQGISQYYVAVTNTAAGEEAPDREILLHLANHGNEGFRVNADVLRFQLGNELPKFAADPAAPPLRAYVFIERAHYFSGETQETPRGYVCVNLRQGPYTPILCQALVDLDTEAGVDIAPLVGWGALPKAVIVNLKHTNVQGASVIGIADFICGNWLVAYPKASSTSVP